VNSYELAVVFRVSESLDVVKEKLAALLQKFGATIVSENPWGVRRLSYMIDGEKEGNYLFYTTEAPPEAIKKISGEFRLNQDILRFLFVKLKKQKSA